MTGVLTVGIVVAWLAAPRTAETIVVGYVVLLLGLWWITSGSRPWVWPHVLQTPQQLPGRTVRFACCVLQMNRALWRLARGTLIVTTVTILVASGVTAGVVGFDFLVTQNPSLHEYVEFYDDDLPSWITTALHGHAGAPAFKASNRP